MRRRTRDHAFVIGALILIAAQIALVAKLQARPVMPLDFERSIDFQGFGFYDGSEFPGASGAFGRGPGFRGAGAELRFAFECEGDQCGRYVAAVWTPTEPIAVTPSTHLVFDFKPAEAGRLALRIEDESRQTFQIVLPVETPNNPTLEGWRRLVFSLDVSGGEYWGGANTGKLEGRIRSIAFLAQRTGEGSSGAFGLDGLAVADLGLPAELRLQRDPPLVRTLDLAPPTLGVGTQRISDLAALDQAHGNGADLIRVDLPWWNVEQGGRFDFSAHDRLLTRLAKNGQTAILLTSFRHAGYGSDPFGDARHREAYLRYLRTAAAHYRGRNVIWEIINEPDAPGDNHVPPEQFAVLLAQSARAIRETDPNARLITGGLSWANPDYLARMLPALGKDRAAVGMFEGFGLHLYRLGGPESAASSVALTRRGLVKHLGKDLPIWVTEWGYSSFDLDPAGNGHSESARAAQAAHLQRILATLSAVGAPVYAHYVLHDNGPDPRNNEHNHGLLTSTGARKPVFAAFAAFADAAKDRRVAGMLADLPDGLMGLRLSGAANDDVIMLWTIARGGSAEIMVSGDEFAEWRSATGAATRLKPGEMRPISLSLADGPAFFIQRP